ncbi:MAG: 1-deoxy-D-xylulose-5-phosphate reductoisomerase [Candidatus Omnitrophica bacterium]|nr:1-deoxy-D-xylulose-5-phosphate reductoisomerase [Candidatus Omnitrophota bacterium]
MKRKNVVILGSTGSIGVNALKIIERFPHKFRIVGLTAYNNYRLLEEQSRRFKPFHVAASQEGVRYLRRNIGGRHIKIGDVATGAEEIAQLKSADIVVVAMQGSAALKPFLAAVRSGKTVAPANKEALVIAGDLLMREAARHKASIVPIDSEQSAIFQCLEGRERADVRKIYLTASGGPLLRVPKIRFDRLSVRDILRHPRWKMGKRITVDSATLINKGFEVIEAKHLFGLDVKDIEVLVHPEAIIHSMVELRDGSVLAQLGVTDMRIPIQYALTYPQRWDTGLRPVNFARLRQLTFEKPDFRKFPSLALAIEIAEEGGTLPGVLNAADEVAVEAYLDNRLRFTAIYDVVEKVVRRHRLTHDPSLDAILAADQWARGEAAALIKKIWKRS